MLVMDGDTVPGTHTLDQIDDRLSGWGTDRGWISAHAAPLIPQAWEASACEWERDALTIGRS
jgi:hypothetical protein